MKFNPKRWVVVGVCFLVTGAAFAGYSQFHPQAVCERVGNEARAALKVVQLGGDLPETSTGEYRAAIREDAQRMPVIQGQLDTNQLEFFKLRWETKCLTDRL